MGSSWRKAVESALSFSAATLPFDEFFVLALVAQNHRSFTFAFTQPADRRSSRYLSHPPEIIVYSCLVSRDKQIQKIAQSY